MKSSFEQALIEVWRQGLVENAKTVQLGAERFPVRRIPKRGLRQVDFVVDGNGIRAQPNLAQVRTVIKKNRKATKSRNPAYTRCLRVP